MPAWTTPSRTRSRGWCNSWRNSSAFAAVLPRSGFDVSPFPSSGEGGIRTLGRVAPTPVFETRPRPTEGAVTESTSDDGHSRFAHPFAQSGQASPPGTPTPPVVDPDLRRVLDAWPSLSEPIRRAVLALVDSAGQGVAASAG